MIVTKNENIVYFDVDSTLCFKTTQYHPDAISLDYYGEMWYIRPHIAHIEFLKSLRARGYYIIVHSSNGWQHAEKAVIALELTNFVDEVKVKSNKYVDDEEVNEWFGKRIYLKDNADMKIIDYSWSAGLANPLPGSYREN